MEEGHRCLAAHCKGVMAVVIRNYFHTNQGGFLTNTGVMAVVIRNYFHTNQGGFLTNTVDIPVVMYHRPLEDTENPVPRCKVSPGNPVGWTIGADDCTQCRYTLISAGQCKLPLTICQSCGMDNWCGGLFNDGTI
ncbi:unnamed protein product [Merluccius merluccius]